MGSVAVSSSMTKGKSSRSSLSRGTVGAAISSFCSHGDEVFLLDVSLSLVADITSASFFDKSKGCSIIDGFSGSAKGTKAGGIFDSLRSLAHNLICLYFAYLYDTSRKIDVIGDHDDLLLFRSRIDGIITFQNSKLFIIYERPSSDSSTVVVLKQIKKFLVKSLITYLIILFELPFHRLDYRLQTSFKYADFFIVSRLATTNIGCSRSIFRNHLPDFLSFSIKPLHPPPPPTVCRRCRLCCPTSDVSPLGSPPPALPPAVPGTARCYPRAIRACAIYPFVRRAVPSPHPLPASRSPASTSACASAAIKARTVSTTSTCPTPHWSSGTSERS
ncbi:hypothetical protein ALC57_10344 [Trachymyrmex cornetzi]|uniref:Uncharacterized protein n=1 Tax=Trachymyrmex cornetzi TaxID=471704 RepID=A0A195DWV2_9HYME|nr:hypothetical protein ALC57_10344 [Trachymyrmex cornetzi]